MPVFGLPAIFEEGEKTIHDKPQMALGACFGANVDDVLYTYVRFAENVQEGDVMRTKLDHYTKSGLSPKTSGGTDFPAAGSQIISEHDATYLTSLAGIPPEPSNRDYAIIAITGGAGAGQRGYITHYTDKVLNVRWYDTDDGTLKTALGSNSNYVIYAPWYFAQAAANADAAARASVNGVVLARSARKGPIRACRRRRQFPGRDGRRCCRGGMS